MEEEGKRGRQRVEEEKEGVRRRRRERKGKKIYQTFRHYLVLIFWTSQLARWLID